MNTLAKEFETTSQLPPSTPQQRMTPPTVLLPATFAILPPQSAALSAAIVAAGGLQPPLQPQLQQPSQQLPSPSSFASHPSLSVPVLGHSAASTASPNVAGFSFGGAAAGASPNLHPSFIFGSASAYSQGNANSVTVNENGTGVFSETPSLAATAMTTTTECPAPIPAEGNRHPAEDTTAARGRRDGSGLSILLPQPSSASLPRGSANAPVPGGDAERTASSSPADAGSRRSTVDDADFVPITPASSTYAAAAAEGRRSVSAFDALLSSTADRGAGQSRAHSCNSRSNSLFAQRPPSASAPPLPPAAAAATLALTSPTLYNTHVMQYGGPGTPCSAPSSTSTPPAMGSYVSGTLPYPMYPSWGVEGICAFYPITSVVETTTTTAATAAAPAATTAAHDDRSGGRTSVLSNSPSQVRPSHRQSPPTGRTPPTTPDTNAPAGGTAVTLCGPRRASTRTHVSLHEGPVMMTARPVSPSTGRQTPSSPLYVAPAPVYAHADPTRSTCLTGTGAAAATAAASVISPCPSATSQESLPPPATIISEVRSQDGESQRCADREQQQRLRFAATSVSPPLTPTAECDTGAPSAAVEPRHSASIAIANTRSHSGAAGATDPLSDFSSPSPSSSPTQQQQQHHQHQHQQHLSPPHQPQPSSFHVNSSFLHASSPPTHLQQSPSHLSHPPHHAGGGSVFAGNLTFVPIEVQSAATVSPFFGSMSSLSMSAAGTSPALGAHPHPWHSANNRGSTPHDATTSNAVPAMPRLERPASQGDDIVTTSSYPPSAATPTRAPPATPFMTSQQQQQPPQQQQQTPHSSWFSGGPSGTVTAILAAPEVSWSSSYGGGGGGGGLDFHTNATMTREASTTSSTATTADTHSPSTSTSAARAPSPGPWLQRVNAGYGDGSTPHLHGAYAAVGWGPHVTAGPMGESATSTPGSFASGGGNGGGGGGSLHPAHATYASAFPTFNATAMQSQLSCTPVPLNDTESICVICLEGHQTPDAAPPPIAESSASQSSASSAVATSGGVHGGGDGARGVKIGSQLLAMPCRHCCHQNCLQRWLLESTCCPICRRDLTQDATLTL